MGIEQPWHVPTLPKQNVDRQRDGHQHDCHTDGKPPVVFSHKQLRRNHEVGHEVNGAEHRRNERYRRVNKHEQPVRYA